MDIRLIPEDVFEDVKTDEGRTPKKQKIEEAWLFTFLFELFFDKD